MFIDTHCHLNFKAFTGGERKIIDRAKEVGVNRIVVPGTDTDTSRTAVRIAEENTDVFAVVGIHPHHAAQYIGESTESDISIDLTSIEDMLENSRVVGIGEVGLDRHAYTTSRYGPQIPIGQELFALQVKIFKLQIEMATRHAKSLVIHNREAEADLQDVCMDMRKALRGLKGKGVLHCSEADDRLLKLAHELDFYIGVDGDVTYDTKKQAFIRNVPLEKLVLETDSPYILPEPLKTARKYPNTPANIPLIAESVAQLHETTVEVVADVTTRNARALFNLPE